MQKQLSKEWNSVQPEKLRMFGWIDAVVIILIILASIMTFPALHNVQPEMVVIYRENHVVASYPLDTDREIIVRGALGLLTVAIKNHSVSVIKSDCPNGICRKTGSISKPTRQIVCAPNHIVITITSASKGTVDGVAR